MRPVTLRGTPRNPRLLVIIALAAPGLLSAQTVLTGTVREDSTKRPLAGVQVLLEGTRKETTTDNAGRYLLDDLPTGGKVVLFRFVGYRPARIRVQLNKNQTHQQDVSLVSEKVQQLEPVVVEENVKRPRGVGYEGFEERRRLGLGKFLDSSDLRRFEVRRLADLLRGSFGIRMINYQEPLGPAGASREMRYGRVEVRAVSPFQSQLAGEPCYVTVLLDGVAIYRSGNLGNRPPDFSREFSTPSLQAMEYYRSGTVLPLEFSGFDSECGVLVMWTRKP